MSEFKCSSVQGVYHGSCHCGNICFSIRAPIKIKAVKCNCTICTKSGFLHLHIHKSDLTVTRSTVDLAVYGFNTFVAKHMFCTICGVKPFYVPRSHPEGYSVNVNCLDGVALEDVEVVEFNGKSWEAEIEHFPDQPIQA